MASQSVGTDQPPRLQILNKGPRIFRRLLNPIILNILWLRGENVRNTPVEGKGTKVTRTPTGCKIDGGAGAGLGPKYVNGAANGVACYFQVNISDPIYELPDGATVVNPS